MGVAYFVGECAEQHQNTATASLINALGGLLPMIPYFIFVHNVQMALFVSIGITAVVLIAFGKNPRASESSVVCGRTP